MLSCGFVYFVGPSLGIRSKQKRSTKHTKYHQGSESFGRNLSRIVRFVIFAAQQNL